MASLYSFLFTASLSLGLVSSQTDIPPVFEASNCDVDTYYASLPANPLTWTFGQIEQLTKERHIRELVTINNIEGGDDVYLALRDLDQGTTPNSVRLIYADIDMAGIPAPNPNTWREHGFWPALRGASAASGAFFDIHMKRPADSTVLIRKLNLFFGECGTVADIADCVRPATSETANTTETDGKIWAPPVGRRGEVARALLYGALRYREDGLILSDCPPFGSTEFGYRSQLLKWHKEEPVSDAERQRNMRACERWQGNRNPFVDHPQIAENMFGTEDTIIPGTMAYTQCTDPTQAPTATPNACSDLTPGDTPIFLVNSDDPDNIVIYPLSDIPEAVGSIFVTDNAWDGTQLLNNEGTIEFVIPEGGIRAGRSFGYGEGFPFNDRWKEPEGNFDLGTDGDNIFVYCLDADNKVRFLWGYNYNGIDWAAPGGTAETYGTRESALPIELDLRNVALEHADNCLYTGSQEGFKTELLREFLTSSNYECRDEFRYAPLIPGSSRAVATMAALVASFGMAWFLA